MKRVLSRLNARLRDAPVYREAAEAADERYLAICNRGERLAAAPDRSGFQCEWTWTSELRPPRLIPRLGLLLLQRALRSHPIRRRERPVQEAPPVISFVIGHRGLARLPLLLATVDTIAAQEGVPIECIVVEQDVAAPARDALPAWVRHVHMPVAVPGQPYSRSGAFNRGVSEARADMIVFHDNDMLVPVDYAAQIARRANEGWDVINLKRFVFYLTREHSQRVIADGTRIDAEPPESVVQNLEGGGSIAISRSAFLDVGGWDERFVGWGGEDIEFWQRACTRRVWPYGSLPIVHLWHGDQPGKGSLDNPALKLYWQLAAIPPVERIAQLTARRVVSLEGQDA